MPIGGDAAKAPRALSRLLSILFGAAVVAYPVAVYFGLRNGSARGAALLLLLVFVPAALVRVAKLRREKLHTLALLPLVTVLLLGASAALDAGGFILAVPTV